uniref:Uncharacterized protein n=1 Tax=Physcomitrium patens TaxID=3218 RepID=A0A2K1KTI8_PHYPA|nr:hypothetical protein PHYPA_004097 [Physcomitrium patens]
MLNKSSETHPKACHAVRNSQRQTSHSLSMDEQHRPSYKLPATHRLVVKRQGYSEQAETKSSYVCKSELSSLCRELRSLYRISLSQTNQPTNPGLGTERLSWCK